MRVSLIGATGNAGSRILAELARRGHQVTAIVRHPERVPQLDGVIAKECDANRVDDLASMLRDHDVVVSSVHFLDGQADKLIDAVRQARVPRYVVVGGAGSLDNGNGVKLIDAGGVPEPYKAESRAGCDFLDLLRQTSDLDWTFLSPSAQFVAGERTGVFRTRNRHRATRCKRSKLDFLRGLRGCVGRRDRAAAPFQAPIHGWLLMQPEATNDGLSGSGSQDRTQLGEDAACRPAEARIQLSETGGK